MNEDQIQGFILLAGVLINLGRDAVAVIKDILSREGKTEAEINAVLLAIQDEANRRRAISAAIAFGVPSDAGGR